MRLALTLTAALLAAGLSGCGKSQSQGEQQQAQASSSEQATVAGSAQSAEPAEAEKRTLLAALPAPYNSADLANGKARFALCSACHTITAGGPNMTGPNLHGVVGRKAASLPGYNYSDALKKTGYTWDVAHLDPWIADPRSYVPGTKMTFAGLKNPKDRADLIAYVMVESGYRP